jgi:hypothetical protein
MGNEMGLYHLVWTVTVFYLIIHLLDYTIILNGEYFRHHEGVERWGRRTSNRLEI